MTDSAIMTASIISKGASIPMMRRIVCFVMSALILLSVISVGSAEVSAASDFTSGNKIIEILNNNGDEIKSAVLATEIVTGSTDGFEKSWNVNGEEVTLAVKKN